MEGVWQLNAGRQQPSQDVAHHDPNPTYETTDSLAYMEPRENANKNGQPDNRGNPEYQLPLLTLSVMICAALRFPVNLLA
jgi:hypothetical protein